MTTAFVFPGQGSQSVGMGKDLADTFAEAAAVFAEVDDALGEKLSDTIWNGPDEALTLTANAQPALMAVSIAVVRVLEAKGYDLAANGKYAAGHSLGEYSAYAACGTFSISDTAKLLRTRGNAMQAAVPSGEGAMAAIIGLDAHTVTDVCERIAAETSSCCQIANDNGGGQLVISGSKAAVEKAAAELKEAGAKRALLLPVSAPFHSALMEPAASVMEKALSEVATTSPSLPIIANVRVAAVSEPTEIVSCLVEQVTGQVRWRETVEWFAANGVTQLVEIGSGKVLSGLAKRIDRSINAVALSSPSDIDAFLAAQAT
ncbi:MAG: ACP S-malonyltransferase [Pseudomonadota bacterium]